MQYSSPPSYTRHFRMPDLVVYASCSNFKIYNYYNIINIENITMQN